MVTHYTSKDGRTTIVTSTTTTLGSSPVVASSVVPSSVFSDPRSGDTWQRHYVWNGEMWTELDPEQRPVGWIEAREEMCPVYGSEENAYEAGFAEGKIAERLEILEDFNNIIASNDDMELQDAADIVWDRMTDEQKEEKWPV